MTVTCPECKNTIDLAAHADLKAHDVFECDMCGITLEVTKMDGDTIEVDIVDEGK